MFKLNWKDKESNPISRVNSTFLDMHRYVSAWVIQILL